MEQINSIDLFAGIGGIRLGFDQAFGDSLKTVNVVSQGLTFLSYYELRT